MRYLLLVASIMFAAVLQAASQDSQGWQIPPTAAAEANPVPLTPKVVERGRELYRSKCQKCHGPSGRGNGPDADPDHPPGNLTDPKRAPRNPDGVMFYKIWNGRSDPKMPAFKTDMPREDVWTVIHFVKTFRRRPAAPRVRRRRRPVEPARSVRAARARGRQAGR